MKCIILCAEDVNEAFEESPYLPRALLNITENKTILDYMVEKLEEIEEITEILLATNHRYVEKLEEWKNRQIFTTPITIINDTTNNENEKLGAVGDIAYVINYKNIKDDLMVIFGDNLFEFPLEPIINDFNKRKTILLAGQLVEHNDILSGLGVMEINGEGKLLGFEEKVEKPHGNIKSLGIYLFPQTVLPFIKKYLQEGNRTEAPGYFIHYLYKMNEPIFVHEYKGSWFDINSLSELSRAKKNFIKKD